MKFRLAFIFLIFSFAPAAHGQVPQPEKIDPAKEAAIRELIQVSGQGLNTGDFLRQLFAQVRALVPAQKDMPPERKERFNRLMDRLTEKLVSQLEKEIAQMEQYMVPIYARHFTDAEIQATLEFYESPAGKKWVAKLPELMQELMIAWMPRLRQINEEFMEEMMAELKKEFPDLTLPTPDPKN